MVSPFVLNLLINICAYIVANTLKIKKTIKFEGFRTCKSLNRFGSRLQTAFNALTQRSRQAYIARNSLRAIWLVVSVSHWVIFKYRFIFACLICTLKEGGELPTNPANIWRVGWSWEHQWPFNKEMISCKGSSKDPVTSYCELEWNSCYMQCKKDPWLYFAILPYLTKWFVSPQSNHILFGCALNKHSWWIMTKNRRIKQQIILMPDF